MRRLYLTCGIPGSGKSTWAKARSEEGWSWNSRDKIRFSKITEQDDYFAFEDEVFDTFVSDIQNDIYDKFENIIADATHLNEFSRDKLLNRLSLNGYEVWYVVFDIPLEIALARNALRTGRIKVPDSVIEKMYNSFKMPIGNVIVINEKGEIVE